MNELANLTVVTRQHSMQGAANDEELCTVSAGDRRREYERARCQPYGLAVSPAEEADPIRQCPNLTLRLKDKVFSIRSPFASGVT